MNLETTRKTIDAHGLSAGLRDLAYRGANRVTEVTVLNAMTLTMGTLDRSFLDGSSEGWGWVDRDVLIEQVRTHGAKLDTDEAEIVAVTARGDRCYGAMVDGALVSYGWYSSLPTYALDGLTLHFSPAWAYMYKGFTLPAHRGKRLHGLGMARALAALTAEGKSGLVSYVRANNFSSLKSCYRMGYVDFGRLVVVGARGRFATYASPGCKAYDFRLERGSPAAGSPAGRDL